MKIFNSKLLLCAFLFAAMVLPSRGQIYDMYLTMTGVTGEGPTNSMVISSFEWGVSVEVSPFVGGNRAVSLPTFSELSVTKLLDKASPDLIFFCASGSLRTTAVLTVKHPTTGQALHTITLGNVYISKVNSSGSGERPTETVSLNFGTITWVYQKLDGSGNPSGSPVSHNWNLVNNTGS